MAVAAPTKAPAPIPALTLESAGGSANRDFISGVTPILTMATDSTLGRGGESRRVAFVQERDSSEASAIKPRNLNAVKAFGFVKMITP